MHSNERFGKSRKLTPGLTRIRAPEKMLPRNGPAPGTVHISRDDMPDDPVVAERQGRKCPLCAWVRKQLGRVFHKKESP